MAIDKNPWGVKHFSSPFQFQRLTGQISIETGNWIQKSNHVGVPPVKKKIRKSQTKWFALWLRWATFFFIFARGNARLGIVCYLKLYRPPFYMKFNMNHRVCTLRQRKETLSRSLWNTNGTRWHLWEYTIPLPWVLYFSFALPHAYTYGVYLYIWPNCCRFASIVLSASKNLYTHPGIIHLYFVAYRMAFAHAIRELSPTFGPAHQATSTGHSAHLMKIENHKSKSY